MGAVAHPACWHGAGSMLNEAARDVRGCTMCERDAIAACKLSGCAVLYWVLLQTMVLAASLEALLAVPAQQLMQQAWKAR